MRHFISAARRSSSPPPMSEPPSPGRSSFPICSACVRPSIPPARPPPWRGFCSKMGLATGPLLGASLLGGTDYPLLIDVAVLALVASGAAALLPAHACSIAGSICQPRFRHPEPRHDHECRASRPPRGRYAARHRHRHAGLRGARARTPKLWDVEGKRYVDFAGGIAVLNTGHRHPKVLRRSRRSSKPTPTPPFR